MSMTVSLLDPVTKRLYPKLQIGTGAFSDHPILEKIPKATNFKGSAMQVPVPHARNNTVSALWSASDAIADVARDKGFLVTRIKKYARATLEREAMMAVEQGEGAFVTEVKRSLEGAKDAMMDAVAAELFRSGSGTIGRISTSASVGASTVRLENPADIVNFSVGDAIQLTDTDSGTLRSSGDDAIITGITEDGDLTFAGALTAEIAAAAAGDYIVRRGDLDAALSGFAAWVPSTAPTSGDSFFGVDRSANTIALAGLRVDGTSLELRAALSKGARLCNQLGGGKPNLIAMNPEKWEELSLSVNSNVVHNAPLNKGEVGFRSLLINVAGFACDVVPDRFCPVNKAYVLTKESWKLHTLGGFPEIDNVDGIWHRLEAADEYEARVIYYGNLVCYKPGHNAVVSL